ncbi:polysaccharide deacetylase family protein [Flavitalea flava]
MRKNIQIPVWPLLPVGLLLLFLITGCGPKKEGQEPATNAEESLVSGHHPALPFSPKDSAFHFDSAKRYIYLTFDDAPQPPGTTNCANVFRKQGIKATFFLVGMHMEIDPLRVRMVDTLRKSYPEFLIANHSYSHAFRNNYKKYYAHPASAVEDLMKAQALLQIPARIIRLPGNNAWVGDGENKGTGSTMAVRKMLDSMGYKVIGWDVEWSRKGNSTPKQSAGDMVKEVNSKFSSETTNQPNTIVILAHDRMFVRPQYVDSLAKFIVLLKSDSRNVFETIDHYPLVMGKEMIRKAPASEVPGIKDIPSSKVLSGF